MQDSALLLGLGFFSGMAGGVFSALFLASLARRKFRHLTSDGFSLLVLGLLSEAGVVQSSGGADSAVVHSDVVGSLLPLVSNKLAKSHSANLLGQLVFCDCVQRILFSAIEQVLSTRAKMGWRFVLQHLSAEAESVSLGVGIAAYQSAADDIDEIEKLLHEFPARKGLG